MTQPPGRVLDHHPGEHRDEANKRYGIRRLLPEPAPLLTKVWAPGPNLLDQRNTGHCFPAGTLIRMADGSHRPIEAVRCLDEVVTAEGRTGQVMRTMVRRADALTSVSLSGHPTIQSTAEHPFLTARGYVPAGELLPGDLVAVTRYLPEDSGLIPTRSLIDLSNYQGVIVGVVRSGNVRSVISPVPELLGRTPDLGRLLGLYAAEGHVTPHGVVWSYGKHEAETLVPETMALIKGIFGAEPRIQVRPNNVVQVRLYGAPWARLFKALIPGTSREGDKHLSSEVTSGGPEYLRALYEGWLAGDGHQRRKEWKGTTVCPRLAQDMHAIATGLGYRPTLTRSVPAPNQYARKRQPRFDVTQGTGGGSNRSARQDEAAVWRRVEEVTSSEWDGWVYNLSVAGDNSYVANGLGVHNCGGFAAANEAQASPVRVKGVDDTYAHGFYYEIKDRHLDPWGREDGTSTQAVMNLGRIRGLWAGYAWGFNIEDTYRQLQVGPVLAGTSWLTGMLSPNSDGVIRATGQDEGGHLWCVIGRYRNYRGPSDKTYGPALKIRNSWGPWGLRGSAVLPEADAAHVIYELDGECGVPLKRGFPPAVA